MALENDFFENLKKEFDDFVKADRENLKKEPEDRVPIDDTKYLSTLFEWIAKYMVSYIEDNMTVSVNINRSELTGTSSGTEDSSGETPLTIKGEVSFFDETSDESEEVTD